MARLRQATSTSNLSDIVGQILDKGIVIDLWAKLLLLGTEILSLEARVVVASVETYLRYAEAIGLTRLTAPVTAAIAAPAPDLSVQGLEISMPAVR
jgi:gas vesicle structural protein